MIDFINTNVFGWESAIRGMRNPLNSWNKSDSKCVYVEEERDEYPDGEVYCTLYRDHYEVGENDLKLMKSLSKAGSDHAKFLRMIHVQCDIIAPLYWWKQADTYKVATVTNSTSTMHKIHAKWFELDDFSYEHLHDEAYDCLINTIGTLNEFRRRFINYKDKEDWWQIIQLLPSSYNQLRTMDFNYQTIKSMYWSRKNHKLDEWHDFCDWALTLPYFKEICVDPFMGEE